MYYFLLFLIMIILWSVFYTCSDKQISCYEYFSIFRLVLIIDHGRKRNMWHIIWELPLGLQLLKFFPFLPSTWPNWTHLLQWDKVEQSNLSVMNLFQFPHHTIKENQRRVNETSHPEIKNILTSNVKSTYKCGRTYLSLKWSISQFWFYLALKYVRHLFTFFLYRQTVSVSSCF